jgi:hypothetical protein
VIVIADPKQTWVGRLIPDSHAQIGGFPMRVGVYLSTIAPAGGAVVSLDYSSVSATTPASVYFPAGTFYAEFPVYTSAVVSATSAVVKATYNGKTLQLPLIVLPSTTEKLSVNFSSVQGGLPVVGTVTLAGPAPAGGLKVKLRTSNAAATVPGTITIPAGQTSGSFTISTSVVTATVSATVTATTGAVVRSCSLKITP